MARERMRRAVRKAVAILLTLVFIGAELNGLSFKAHAATGKSMDNTYILALTNGALSSATDNIIMFSLTYTSGQYSYRQLFFMDRGAYKDGFDIVSASGLKSSNSGNTYYELTGYQPVDRLTPFQAVGTEMFMFQTEGRSIDKIDKIEVFTRTEQSTGKMKSETWNLQQMAVYKVDTLYGYSNTGTYAGRYYFDFDGRILAETAKAGSITWNTDAVITFAPSGGNKTLKTYPASESGHEYSTHNSNYTFKIDITDEAMAGIEEFCLIGTDTRETLSSFKIPECLYLKIEYRDMGGNVQRMYIPVITSALTWLSDKGIGTAQNPVAALFQQGDDIVFSANLPGFKTLLSTQFTFNMDSDGSLNEKCGIVEAGNKSEHAAYKDKMADEALIIDGMQMYRTDQITVTADMLKGNDVYGIESKQGRYSVNITGNPIYYYTADTAKGTAMAYGFTTDIRMTEYTQGKLLAPKTQDKTNLYLVSVTTSNSLLATTKSDIGVKLDYFKTDSYKATTDEISLRDAVNDFLGYWPSEKGNAAYAHSVSAGKTANFLVALNNAAELNAITLELKGQDEWQFEKIEIRKVKKLYNREVFTGYNHVIELEGEKYYTKEFVNRRVEGELLVKSTDEVLLHEGARKVTLTFGSTAVLEQDEAFEWEDYRYSMSYEVANKDLGFTKAVCKYLVTVTVADNVVGDEVYGDSGSKNNFYFRLIFENGSSGYVLANQQLSADGFRAGYQENFYIYTNSDYGNLISVNIVPDDISSNNKIDDKLEIKSIRVVKQDGVSMNHCWGIDHVGWIGIDIRDEGALKSSEKPVRYEAQMAKIYVMEYQKYEMNLLFTVPIFDYENENPVFSGAVGGVINYIDINDVEQTAAFDIVEAINIYTNKQTSKQTVSRGTKAPQDEEMYLTDPSYMFAPGKTTRFLVSLQDPKIIKSLTFQFCSNSKNGTTIRTGLIGVSSITSDGEFKIIDGEIVRTGTTNPITQSIPSRGSEEGGLNEAEAAVRDTFEGHEFFVAGGNCQEWTVVFEDQVIEVNESSWSASITREPTSANDTVNVIAVMNDYSDPMSFYDMCCTLNYSRVDGQNFMSRIEEMNKDTASNCFYFNGIKASQMAKLNSVSFRAYKDNGIILSAKIDKLIVQHIRGGVVMNSYCYEFGTGVGETITEYPVALRERYSSGAKQVVMISAAEGSEAFKLLNEKRDIAVSIVYKTTYDQDRQYQSKYKFLTDDENTYLRAGNSVMLTFNEEFVDEIVGVNLIPTDKVNITIDGVAVGVYQPISDDDPEGDKDDYRIADWYSFAGGGSFAGGTVALNTPVRGLGSVESLMPVTFTINTMENGDGVDNGTLGRIAMDITYTGLHNETDGYVHIDNLNNFVPSQSFEAGGEVSFTLLLPALKQIRNIRLTPECEEGDLGWGLANIGAKYYIQEYGKLSARYVTKSKTVNSFISAGTTKEMCFSDIAIVLSVVVPSADGGAAETFFNVSSTDKSDERRLVEAGRIITVDVTMQNAANNAYAVKCVERSSLGHENNAMEFISDDRQGRLMFRPPVTTVTSQAERVNAIVTYVLTVYSTEDDSFSASVEFGVKPELVEPEQNSTPGIDPELIQDLFSDDAKTESGSDEE